MKWNLAELAKAIGAQAHGSAPCTVVSIATLESAQSGQASFLSNPKFRDQLSSTHADVVIMREQDLGEYSGNALLMADPYIGYAKLAQLLDSTPASADMVHPSAFIDPLATLGKNVAIAANAVIESGVVIGDNTQIGAGCFIGKNTQIGANTKLWANVSIYHNIVIGDGCIIHSATVIGSDGFGYAPESGQWLKIPQTGRVVIGSHTEIGASTTIDRGALDDTIIGDGVIIDNQVHIAHNVNIGDYTAIAGATTFAGSVTVGKNCIFGGACAINGHLNICDGVTITGMTMIINHITEAGVYSSGMPAQSNRDWRKNAARYRQLGDMAKRIKQLENQLKN